MLCWLKLQDESTRLVTMPYTSCAQINILEREIRMVCCHAQAVHPSQLAVYAWAGAACLASWAPSGAFAGRQLAAAVASSEGLVFAVFDGGVPEVAVLTASELTLIAHISAPGQHLGPC